MILNRNANNSKMKSMMSKWVNVSLNNNLFMYWAIGRMNRVSANGPVIQRLKKMVLDAALLNTQHYKVRTKGKVEQSREWSSTLPYTSVLQLLKREPSGHLRVTFD